jgi:outer membrane lipoprotein LolB
MRFVGALLLAVLASACATIETQTDGLTYGARVERLQAETAWQMRGRIAVDTGEDAYQGRFTWWQDGDAMRVNIRGPLGVGAVDISGTQEALTLRARGDSWRLDNAETQLSELLGWWLPISSLPHWLLGVPDPHFESADRVVSKERLDRLEQRSWTLHFSRYALANEFEHAQLELIVSIDEWQFDPNRAVKP